MTKIAEFYEGDIVKIKGFRHRGLYEVTDEWEYKPKDGSRLYWITRDGGETEVLMNHRNMILSCRAFDRLDK